MCACVRACVRACVGACAWGGGGKGESEESRGKWSSCRRAAKTGFCGRPAAQQGNCVQMVHIIVHTHKSISFLASKFRNSEWKWSHHSWPGAPGGADTGLRWLKSPPKEQWQNIQHMLRGGERLLSLRPPLRRFASTLRRPCSLVCLWLRRLNLGRIPPE